MRRIDELYLKWPFYGSRRMTAELSTKDCPVNRKRIQRLMKVRGIEAIYPRKRTTIRSPDHRVYPYFAPRADDRSGKPSVVQRHYLHPAYPRIHVFGCSDGLVQPMCSCLELVEHVGRAILRSSFARRADELPTGHFQHGPRESVHEFGIHQDFGRAPDRDQHGWPRPGVGQRIYRTPVEKFETRGHLPQGLRVRSG